MMTRTLQEMTEVSLYYSERFILLLMVLKKMYTVPHQMGAQTT